MNKECVFYDKNIQKIVPCLIVSGDIIEVDNFGIEYYIKISFDNSRYSEYNTSREELLRYSNETIKLMDVYPAVTNAQKNYFNKVFPKKFAKTTTPFLVTSSNNTDELDRFESVFDMLLDSQIDVKMFSKLINFVMYNLYFMYCNTDEKAFLYLIGNNILTEQPTTVYVPQILRMLLGIFNNFDITNNDIDRWKILNFKNMSAFKSEIPFTFSLVYLKQNVNYIII